MEFQEHNQQVCVIGLGYVGLTLSLTLTNHGEKVTGVETNKHIISSLKDKKPHFYENGLEESLRDSLEKGNFAITDNIREASDCSVFIISVGTPLDKNNNPDFKSLNNCLKDIISIKPEKPLIIVRSTVQIGTTINTVKKAFEEAQLDCNIAMCPERTAEGKAMLEITEMPQIIGGIDQESTNRAESFFSNFNKKTMKVSSPETAEIIKLIDNCTRDLGFSISNEIGNMCDALNLDVYEVINSATEGYPRTNIPLPGLVGGPCLEKDPFILDKSLKDFGFNSDIFNIGRRINRNMPNSIKDWLSRFTNLENKKFGIAGIAFKGNPETSDLRGSLSIDILKILEALNKKEVNIFDPVPIDEESPDFLSYYSQCQVFNNFEELIKNTDLLVIANNHNFFKSIYNTNKIWEINPQIEIYDFWNNLANNMDELNKTKYKVFGVNN